MTFGEFLSQILDWLYRFWPMRIVHDWEQGVRCRFGNATSLLTSSNGIFDTGFHVFWPVIGEINIYETNIEVSETELQTHTSAVRCRPARTMAARCISLERLKLTAKASVIAQRCRYCGLESWRCSGRKKTCKERGQQSIIMASPSGSSVMTLSNTPLSSTPEGLFLF